MKQQDLAIVTRVEELEGYEDRCRVFFCFDAITEDADSEDITAFLGSLVRNNEYNAIARIPKNETLETLETKLVDHKGTFTVYTFEISKLLEGTKYDGVNEVWNAESEEEDGFRAYSSFNKCYVGKFDDEQSAFTNVKRKLLKRLEDEVYFTPFEEAEEVEEKPKRSRK